MASAFAFSDPNGTCGLGGTGDLSNTNPVLAPLGDYGGPTFTHALLSVSPAIDHVPFANCTVATDQRGVPRPQGPGCEIGAFESGAPCTLLLDPSYMGNTMNLDFTLGSQTAVTWNLWFSFQTITIPLWSFPLPVLDPPINIPIPIQGFPQIGRVGFLTTLTTPGDGIVCSAWETVDTGAPAVMPTARELKELFGKSAP